jgi:AraC-like DNA-binding protein
MAVVVAFRRLLTLDAAVPNEPRRHNATSAMREYLDAHVADDVSLQELADLVGMTRSHACTAFRRAVGVSPHAYQIQARIRQGREMLACGASIADVVAVTGFYDQSHFTRHFKREVGITPARYGRAPSSAL